MKMIQSNAVTALVSGRHSVWGILINQKGKVLVAKRAPKSNNPHLLNFPGGGVDDGETISQAIAREMKEEIGVDRSQLTLVKRVTLKTREKYVHGIVYRCWTTKIKLNKNELSGYKWMKMEDIVSSTKSPKKWHIPTFLLMHSPDVVEYMERTAIEMTQP